MSPDALAFMAEGLADLPPERLDAAAAAARAQCHWFPTVAELRELAGVRTPNADEQRRAEELAAWEIAVRWVRRYAGRLRNHETGRLDGFEDANDYSWVRTPPKPIVPLPPRVEWAVRQIGGAQAVAESLEEPEAKAQWLRKAFFEAYRLAEAPEVLRLVEGVTGRLGSGRPQ